MKLKATIVILSSLLLSVWLLSCVDVSSTGPTPPEFNSEFRFLNALTILKLAHSTYARLCTDLSAILLPLLWLTNLLV